MTDRALWASASRRPLDARGFDDQRVAPYLAVPARGLGRPACERDIRASFAAIADIAGFTAKLVGLDPDDREQARRAFAIATEIESLARGVRHAAALALEPETAE